MDPNQQPQPQPGYPPQTPQPGPAPYAPQPQNYPQPPAQPYQPPQPQAAPYTPPQPHQPAANSWYTPAPKPDANKPGDVSSYLQSAGMGASSQPQPGAGQTINGQYSIDYLDQMAAPVKQPIDKKFIFAGIGVAIALLIAMMLMFITPQRSTSVANEISLYTTMIDVEKSTDQSERNLKSSGMSSTNSAMRSALSNAARDMQTPLTNMGQEPSKLKSAATKPPYHDDKLVTTLEDARLNGIYDRVYAREMNTKMKLMLSYMESIEKHNSRESMKEFISKNKQSFETVQKSIEDWQSSDEAQFF